jgi:glycosyltransferase involved in cell wall biosynthesis
MRIIAPIHKNSGVSYHRLIAPLMMMEDMDVCITNSLQDESFVKGCDLLYYNRVLPDTSDEHIQRLQKIYGFRIAVDVDDWWYLDPHHILYDTYIEEGFAARQVRHIKNADIVTTTHERLADMIRPYNKNVFVLPNAIPRSGQFDIERTPSEYVRLFWQGSVTHRKDIEIIKTAIDRLAPIATQIKMVLAGFHEDADEWQAMASDYTAGFKHQYKVIEGMPAHQYYAAYKEADICLVPLVNSPFNRMKSNLKVLEAGNLGLPCVVSNVHPYKGMPVLYSSNPNEWVQNVKRLVANKTMREDVGGKLKDWCEINYNFKKINEMRRDVLVGVMKKENQTI